MCVYVCVLQDGSLVVPAYMDAEHGMVRHLNSHMGMSPKGEHHMHHGLAHSLQQDEDERYHDEREGEERQATLRGGVSILHTILCHVGDKTIVVVVVTQCASHGSMVRAPPDHDCLYHSLSSSLFLIPFVTGGRRIT